MFGIPPGRPFSQDFMRMTHRRPLRHLLLASALALGAATGEPATLALLVLGLAGACSTSRSGHARERGWIKAAARHRGAVPRK
jgi:hypothetical protein